MSNTLFSPITIGHMKLKNRVVMAPMTRSRAINGIPNAIMAQYYGERATAGLIITEGVAPSPNGSGYARIPGLWSEEHINGWKLVTDSVHKNGGLIFSQIMHTGRASHADNMTEGSEIVAPSAIKLSGEIYTDSKGLQSYPEPKAMTLEDIKQAQNEFVQAAVNAIKAGFDGVEIHGANGYLIDQFLNIATNQRTDEYGGSLENRNRFLTELLSMMTEAIGADKIGLRVSPFGVFNDMGVADDIHEQYAALTQIASDLKIAYIHVVDLESMGASHIPSSIKQKIRETFDGAYILSGGYDKAKANQDLDGNLGELVAFGRPFISNSNLVEKLQNDMELTSPNPDTFYTPGEEGYLGY